MVEVHGLERTVKVEVRGLPGDVYNFVYERLKGILPNLAYFGTGNGDIATVYLAPISDIDYFASQIDLGEVTSVDRENRVILVVADRARMPKPKTQGAGGVTTGASGERLPADLASLCERLGQGDRSAVDDLIAFGSAAESDVAPYAGHGDRRVRRGALLVLKKIATAASVPVLLAGLSDADMGNRDLAWQTICRVPGLIERREVIEAAAVSLNRDPEQAAKWLTAIGPVAERAVWPYTRGNDDRVRLQALDVLRQVGTLESLATIDELGNDTVEEVAAAAKAAREAIVRRHER
jgi:hypothetical protein